MASLRWRTTRGVKPLLTRRRARLCLGGSMLRIDRRILASASSVWVSMNVPPSSDENVSLSWLTATTSACFVSTQNPGPVVGMPEHRCLPPQEVEHVVGNAPLPGVGEQVDVVKLHVSSPIRG